MRRLVLLCVAFLAAAAGGWEAKALQLNPFRADAEEIERLVAANYAYLDRFPGGAVPLPDKLRAEAKQVNDRRSLIRYAERVLLALADHHAITGSSRPDSWALVPSYADMWVEKQGAAYVIEAVRQGTPAEAAGVRAGDRLVAVDDVATDSAVTSFWQDLGLAPAEDRAGFAARVLAAGGRDKSRTLTIQRGQEPPRRLVLPSLYAAGAARPQHAPLTAQAMNDALVIRFHDSLGDERSIAAFDAAMAQARPKQKIVIDLTDTPSGGNTVVARAVMGWFVTKPTAYQIHSLPEEERRTGIPRQWIEQVLPRRGKYHDGSVEVRVGRWTGSMGEGMAIGFAALGADVRGDRMAGLLGAIYDYTLPNSGLVFKLPTERLMAVDGTPREQFVPRPIE